MKSTIPGGGVADEGGRPPRGGRGLKYHGFRQMRANTPSPPSRGAWIEISKPKSIPQNRNVAPLAGGVD